MKTRYIAVVVLFLWFLGCSGATHQISTAGSIGFVPSDLTLQQVKNHQGEWLPWGFFRLRIDFEKSAVSVTPDRSASTDWGYHLNAVKLLENSPCTNCINTSNVHVLPDGNLSIDISITHPYGDPVYTGFDVRGIVMFPASQEYPDNELRVQAGLEPWDSEWRHWFSRSEKGDAELVNAEGWTVIWAPAFPVSGSGELFQFDSGYPIFSYYPGKYASGEESSIGTINPFLRFHSNPDRHMFEVGQIVTRTYVIKPPASGPVEACYAIYAHWAEPLTIPVDDPATDFPPEANSPMPYEFWVTQDQVIDPDALPEESAKYVHWHIKTWSIGMEYWESSIPTLLYETFPGCEGPILGPHPSGQQDDYTEGIFCTNGYAMVLNAFPGKWPYLFILHMKDPKKPPWDLMPIGCDVYIADIDIGPIDGQW